eukprot:jgi/Ulvmu1/2323/UM013_0171.1
MDPPTASPPTSQPNSMPISPPISLPISQPISPVSMPPRQPRSRSGSEQRPSSHSTLIESSSNTSMASMHPTGTPVSHVGLPRISRSEAVVSGEFSSDSCNTQSRVNSAANSRSRLRRSSIPQLQPFIASERSAAEQSAVPHPMFDSFLSAEELGGTDDTNAGVDAQEDSGSNSGETAQHAQHAASQMTPMPVSATLQKLRSNLPHPEPEVVEKAVDDVLHADLPLHVKVDLARAQRRPTAIAKLGEWTPYEASPAESYLYKPPRQFFQLRWALMRYNPLTWHCSGQPYTIGEALMTFAVVGQMIVTGFWWAIDPDFRVNVSITGTMAVFILMLTFFMAIHSNIVALLLLGLPFDRQLPWHKLLAVSTCFHTVLHLIAFYAGGRMDTMHDADEPYHFSTLWQRKGFGMEVSGWLLTVPIFAMTFMGWSYISRRCFAYFYKVHILSAAATIVGVMLHGFGAAITQGVMPLALPGGAFWLLDLALRATYGSALTNSSKTKLRLIPAPTPAGSPVVSIEVPHGRGRRFTAGQWVFVCLPALGVLHWHPFTIASSSNDADMRVAIACKGKWTGRLAQLAGQQDTAKVYVEGPYGSPMIDVHGPRYRCFLVIAGGIGWTFLRAWRRQLLQDACRGRPVKSVATISVLRAADQHHAAEILDSPAIDGPLVLPADLHLQVLPPTPVPHVLCLSVYLSCRIVAGEDNVFLTGVPKRPTTGPDGIVRLFQPVSLPGVNTTCGRPDFFTLLSDAADIAKALGEPRVAVLVCGSLGIVHSIQDDIPNIATSVSIDLHYEVLAF